MVKLELNDDNVIDIGSGPGEDQVKCQVGFGRVSQGRGLEDRS